MDDQDPIISLEEDPRPSKPGRPGGIDLIIALAIIWGIDIAGQVLLLAVNGLDSKMPDPMQALVITLVMWGVAISVAWHFSCAKYGRSFAEGFGIRRVSSLVVAGSVAAGLVLAFGANLIMFHFGTGKSLIAKFVEAPNGLLVITILALAAPPFEELYYRGFVYPILEKLTGLPVAAGLVIFWFTAIHVLQLIGDEIGIVVILVVSVVFTLQRAYSRSLVPSLVTHWTYNAGIIALARVTGE